MPPYNDFIKDLEAQQLCYVFSGADTPLDRNDLSSNNEVFTKVLEKMAENTDGFFITMALMFRLFQRSLNLLPLPHDVLPLSADIVRMSEVNGQIVWNYGAGYATSLTSVIKHSLWCYVRTENTRKRSGFF